MPKLKLSPTQEIHQWFEKAFPERTPRLFELQLGVMLEEVTELLQALGLPHHELQETSDHLKESRYTDFLETSTQDPSIRTEILDALADITVTTVGVGYSADVDYEGGLKEVVRSNNSKFAEDGSPIYNELTGKLMKAPLYSAPELETFANKLIK